MKKNTGEVVSDKAANNVNSIGSQNKSDSKESKKMTKEKRAQVQLEEDMDEKGNNLRDAFNSDEL